MQLLGILTLYGLCSIPLLAVLLLGPSFPGSPLGRAHQCLTERLPEGTRSAVKLVCGSRGEAGLQQLEHYCCASRNPSVQALYLFLVFAGYVVYGREFLGFLPQAHAPSWHEHSAAVSVGLVLLSFWIISMSDPGYIMAHNLENFLQVCGQPDPAKLDCRTCCHARPAKSKHCPLCNRGFFRGPSCCCTSSMCLVAVRCIARFDHHCAWVNNCVGFLNLRYFLVFLLANFLICLYGVILGSIILRGAMLHSPGFNTPRLDLGTGTVIIVQEHWGLTFMWLASHFSIQVILLVFLTMAGACVGCFLAYHLYLIYAGVTTYERIRLQEQQQPVGGNARIANVDSSGNIASCLQPPTRRTTIRPWWSKFVLYGGPRLDQDVLHRFWEVVFPATALQSHSKLQ